MAKFLNITHGDFDGLVAGACMKIAYRDDIDVLSTSIAKAYDLVSDNIDKYEKVFLTDITCEDSTRLLDFKEHIDTGRLVIYDHHINEKSLSLFSNIANDSDSILDPEFCGATVTWLKLIEKFPNNKKLEEMETIVMLSDVYDMWRIEDKNFKYAVDINNLLGYNLGLKHNEFMNRWISNSNPWELNKKEQKIIEIKRRHHLEFLEFAMNTHYFLEIDNYKMALIVTERATDYDMHTFATTYFKRFGIQLDMVLLKWGDQNKISVRCPINSRVNNLNELEWLHCTGHAKAGGISGNSYDLFVDFLETIIPSE